MLFNIINVAILVFDNVLSFMTTAKGGAQTFSVKLPPFLMHCVIHLPLAGLPLIC